MKSDGMQSLKVDTLKKETKPDNGKNPIEVNPL